MTDTVKRSHGYEGADVAGQTGRSQRTEDGAVKDVVTP